MDRHFAEHEIADVAKEIWSHIVPNDQGATIVGLSGDLGAGKTTLVKALAELLGVVHTVVSPTFVIAKFYETKDDTWSTLVHIDAYRIENDDELIPIGWNTLTQQTGTLVIVEWPERIERSLPQQTQRFHIDHAEHGRRITLI